MVAAFQQCRVCVFVYGQMLSWYKLPLLHCLQCSCHHLQQLRICPIASNLVAKHEMVPSYLGQVGYRLFPRDQGAFLAVSIAAETH